MKTKNQKSKKKLIPIIAMLLMVMILIVIIRKSEQPLSVSTIIRYTPDNEILAAILLLMFFALKSLTVVFPLPMLYFASGILFKPWIAVLISLVGLAITITIPYWIGRTFGRDMIQKMCQRFPKVKQVKRYQEKNLYFACFITRIVGVLPGDIVSLYFGACNESYLVYMMAGITGSLLSIITNTLLGEKISDPFSIEFMIVLLCKIGVSVGAIIIKYKLNKKRS